MANAAAAGRVMGFIRQQRRRRRRGGRLADPSNPQLLLLLRVVPTRRERLPIAPTDLTPAPNLRQQNGVSAIPLTASLIYVLPLAL